MAVTALRRLLLLAALCLPLSAAAGCGGNLAPVQGRVTLDGEPLERGTVVFQSPDRPMAVGDIDSAGRYQLRTGDARGVAPGDYRVTVSAFRTSANSDGSDEPVPQFLTPLRYNTPETSGLEVQVPGGGMTYDIELLGDSEL